MNNYPLSDHFDGKQFYNPWNRKRPSFLGVLRWRLTAKPKPWPSKMGTAILDVPPARVTGPDLRACFVGHSTVLLQTDGLNILTDPMWAQSASPFPWFKIPRFHPPGIDFDDLPKIDIVLISHNHYDHLNLETLQKLFKRDNPRIFAPLGMDQIIPYPTETLDWHTSISIDEETAIHLEPAQHWSKRGLWDTDKTLWGSFVIQTKSGLIYFAGDTGYGPHFKKTHEKFGPFRFALLPIGAYEPRWFLRWAHMSPEDAVLAHRDLGMPPTMAIHHGTFRLSDEGYEDPVLTLEENKKLLGISQELFRALKIGESWNISNTISKS
ncbi:MAG: MBL fold metallo-hydrolase [Verrucomicrobia bacterium]|nr:MBL fold metallo-hydrolase [Verrucomicrobiota bacterium]